MALRWHVDYSVCTALHRYSSIIASHAAPSIFASPPPSSLPLISRVERKQRRAERIPKIQHGISSIYEAAFPRRFVRARAAIAPLIISEIIFFRSQNRARARASPASRKSASRGHGARWKHECPSLLPPSAPRSRTARGTNARSRGALSLSLSGESPLAPSPAPPPLLSLLARSPSCCFAISSRASLNSVKALAIALTSTTRTTLHAVANLSHPPSPPRFFPLPLPLLPSNRPTDPSLASATVLLRFFYGVLSRSDRG